MSRSPFLASLVLMGLAGCGQGGRAPAQPDAGPPGTAGVQGSGGAAPMSTTEAAERARVATALAAVAGLDSAGLATRYPTTFAATLSYDPRTAANLATIRSSRLGLTSAEEEVLVRNGFVISDRQKFPTFTYGYASI